MELHLNRNIRLKLFYNFPFKTASEKAGVLRECVRGAGYLGIVATITIIFVANKPPRCQF